MMSETPLPSILLARQPILNRELKLHAYELLFRSNDPHAATVLDGDLATSQVVLNAVTGITAAADKTVPAFVNMTETMLISGKPPPVPPEWVVLEVLETIAPSQKIIDSLSALKASGYTLALDDFVFAPAYIPMVELADIIKIDIRVHSPEELAEQVQKLKAYNVKLLAEKIETHAEMEYCKNLGFDYFQGYFLHKPEVVRGKKVSANLQLLMTLLAQLQKDDAEPKSVAELIAQDARLSYQLLRIINSALFSRPRAVNSVREAVILLGLQPLRNWIALIAMANTHSKPPELMTSLLVRARTCENLQRHRNVALADAAFTVGLFSGLDALFDVNLPDLLHPLPLHDEVKQALLIQQGELGAVLKQVCHYERAEWDALDTSGCSMEFLKAAYLESLVWTRETLSDLQNA